MNTKWGKEVKTRRQKKEIKINENESKMDLFCQKAMLCAWGMIFVLESESSDFLVNSGVFFVKVKCVKIVYRIRFWVF